ncbi:MAG TPA: TonB-dependent receptor [Bacteroidales bacterium]|nr:TonB-dependent receptor [Bacteroidales bacterium]
MFLCVQSLMAQITVRGIVRDYKGQAMAGATIQIGETGQGTVSSATGTFELSFRHAGDYNIEVRFLSYEVFTKRLTVGQQLEFIEVVLTLAIGLMEEVVVTGTRTSRGLLEVPLRLEVIDNSQVEATPVLSVDDFLKSLPGLNISRGATFLTSATVSMRGMSNEQGRILVMQDGVPLNKTDGGTVNWNALDPHVIERVEVLKGPGSSTHGGNAMGGVINFISTIPTRPLQGFLRQSFGTFGTSRTNVSFSGRRGDFYWHSSGLYRSSDGYITTPVDEINEHSISSFLNEYRLGGRIGYLFSDHHLLEGGLSFYSGQRGIGTLFEGFEHASPDGSYNHYRNWNASLDYSAKLSEHISLNIKGFGQRENYQITRERLSGTRFTRLDVESIRTDMGLFSSFNINVFDNHSLLAGFDFRHGAVDGADIYITSTDEVLNLGKLNQFGIFLQNEFNPGQGRWRLLAGLRFDYATFFDGVFKVQNPTGETAFLQGFDGVLQDASWGAFSPRLSVQYLKEGLLRIFAGYSRGFRAPVLDDLCRTGRIAGGMKIANPYLNPEYLDNFEMGADIFPVRGLRVSPGIFYSIGTDYHAFISTGDSLMIGNRLRPIRIKDNIGKVNIFGAELAAQYQITRNLIFNLSYAFTDTEVVEYRLLNPETEINLKGKELVFQPRNLLYAGLQWQTPWLNVYARFNYKDTQWVNETNTEVIESFSTIDLHLQGNIYRRLSAALMVHNMFDVDYIDSRNIVAPGRMITAELRFSF